MTGVPRGGECRGPATALLLACLVAGGATPARPAVSAGAPAVGAWGWTAHAIVTRAAVDAVPPPMRGFYAEHADFLARHSVDPDRWRADRPAAGLCRPDREPEPLAGDESPRHFLDADAIDTYPFRAIPRDFDAYRSKAGEELSSWGTGPWAIDAYTGLLAAAFREMDTDRILCRSAIVAHYVADLSQPLHLTVNHNGQLSGLDGVHFRFESDLVDFYAPSLEATLRRRALQAVVLDDPLDAVFEMLIAGYPDSLDVLRADLLAQRQRPLAPGMQGKDDPAYMRALWKHAGDLVVERMAHGAEMVASFWLTAWDRAGRPELPQAE